MREMSDPYVPRGLPFLHKMERVRQLRQNADHLRAEANKYANDNALAHRQLKRATEYELEAERLSRGGQ